MYVFSFGIMLIIDWIKKGPKEDIATYKELYLRRSNVTGRYVYFIYRDDVLLYSTDNYTLFMRHVVDYELLVVSVRLHAEKGKKR